MNYLGHCLLSKDHPELISGNLGGDFYKGNLDLMQNVPTHIVAGLRLHRFIDTCTDNSEFIREAAFLFQKNNIQKVSYIACDLLLDHYIAKNWSQFHTEPYDAFVRIIYKQVEADFKLLNAEYQYFYAVLNDGGWLYEYPSVHGIRKIIDKYAKRVPFESKLNDAVEVYLDNETFINTCFKSFMEEVIAKTQAFILSLKY